MGFLDDLKRLTRTYNEDDDADFDGFDDVEMDEPATTARAPRASRNAPAFKLDEVAAAEPATSSQGKVVSLHNGAKMQVLLVRPKRFDEVSDLADSLLERKALALNLEDADQDVARRLVDFLSGCAYAIQGSIRKIAASTYLITPNNMEIVGDLLEELTGNYQES